MKSKEIHATIYNSIDYKLILFILLRESITNVNLTKKNPFKKRYKPVFKRYKKYRLKTVNKARLKRYLNTVFNI